jgi:hypothetical protein
MAHDVSASRTAAFAGKVYKSKNAGQPTKAGSRVYAHINMAFADVEVGDIIIGQKRPWAVVAKKGNRLECVAITKFGVHGLRILNHEPWRLTNEYGPHCPVNAFMYVMHPDAYRFQDQPDELVRSRWRRFITTDDFCELEHVDGLNFSTDLHRESIINFVHTTVLKDLYSEQIAVIGRFKNPMALSNVWGFKNRNYRLFKKAKWMWLEQRKEATGVEHDISNPEERRYQGNKRARIYSRQINEDSGYGSGSGSDSRSVSGSGSDSSDENDRQENRNGFPIRPPPSSSEPSSGDIVKEVVVSGKPSAATVPGSERQALLPMSWAKVAARDSGSPKVVVGGCSL